MRDGGKERERESEGRDDKGRRRRERIEREDKESSNKLARAMMSGRRKLAAT